jgi:hypothetical protein
LCEGKITEREYFDGLRSMHRLPAVRVEGPYSEPSELVQTAIKKRDAASSDPYDEIWCVFDVEYPVRVGLQDTLAIAEEEQFQLALSNPCFELWLILHFKKWSSHLSTSAACTMAETLNGYSEKHIDFSKFADRIAIATSRSEMLNTTHNRNCKNCPDDNPSTNVGVLVSELIKYSRRA